VPAARNNLAAERGVLAAARRNLPAEREVVPAARNNLLPVRKVLAAARDRLPAVGPRLAAVPPPAVFGAWCFGRGPPEDTTDGRPPVVAPGE